MNATERPARTRARLNDESNIGKAYDARLLRRLWRFIAPYRRDFWLAAACLPITSAFSLAQPYILKLTIDRYIAARDLRSVTIMGAAYGAAVLAEFAFLYLQYYLTMLVAQKTLADLRIAVFERIQQLEASFFDRNPVGKLVTRMTTDVDVINEMFAAGAMTLLMDAVTLIGIVSIMIAIDLPLALVSLALLPLMIVAINYFRVKARHSYRLIRERLARLNAYLQEAISGMVVIQLFAREAATRRQFDELNDAHNRANHWSNIYEASLFSFVEAISSMSFALIVWYGGHEILAGTLAFGTLVAFIEYVQKFFVPVRDFSSKYAVMQSAMAAAERVFELLDREPEIRSPAEPRTPTTPASSVIEFDHVWFAYKGDEYVLRDLSFRVTAGERIALVGPTGSGKTTVIKLLNRSYQPQRGRVLVDGIDVREWDLRALRRRIGVVSQDVFLFSGTIADNIALRPEVERETVHRAAETVHAQRFIERLPSGYDQAVRERGTNLSAGQRQLLAFARALAYDPEILVLDEATSSIDTETEMLIEDALNRLMQGRTTLAIAHRLSTIERSDRIIVISKGEIRESGTHLELLAQQGLYARLYTLQRRMALRSSTSDSSSEVLTAVG